MVFSLVSGLGISFVVLTMERVELERCSSAVTLPFGKVQRAR